MPIVYHTIHYNTSIFSMFNPPTPIVSKSFLLFRLNMQKLNNSLTTFLNEYSGISKHLLYASVTIEWNVRIYLIHMDNKSSCTLPLQLLIPRGCEYF